MIDGLFSVPFSTVYFLLSFLSFLRATRICLRFLYGAAGLGLALAVLAYRLLSQEQSIKQPRPAVVQAIYAFMVFALLLAVAGFVSEYLN